MFPKLGALSVLIPLTLAGCATQQSLTEQTLPLQDRLAGLERAIQSASEASQARDAALSREIEGLRGEVRRLSGRADEQAGQTSQLSARLDQAAAQGSALAERMSHAESRLDELATTLPGRLSQTEQRLDGLSAAVQEALALANQENIRINGKEVFSVMLTEDKTLYPINSPELGSQDIGKLDDLVARLAKLDQDYHLEVQGHTDNIGTEDYNYELGKARADVVKRHLHERKGISLSRMSVISFGAGSPLDRTSNRNRRILIRVLVLDKNDRKR